MLLKVNECCQKFTVIILHRFQYVSTDFDAIKRWFWRKTTSRSAEKVWRWESRSFIRSRAESNARKTCRIIKCRSTISRRLKAIQKEWFKSKEIGGRTNWSRKTSKGQNNLWMCCFKGTEEKIFCMTDEKWIYYNNPKNHGADQANHHQQQSRIFMMPMLCIWWDQLGVNVLWAVPTYHWEILPTTIDTIEPSIEAKTVRLREKTRQSDFPRQRSPHVVKPVKEKR